MSPRIVAVSISLGRRLFYADMRVRCDKAATAQQPPPQLADDAAAMRIPNHDLTRSKNPTPQDEWSPEQTSDQQRQP
jgi:hypothetical protein